MFSVSGRCGMTAWKNGSDIADQWSGLLLRTSAPGSHSQRSGHTALECYLTMFGVKRKTGCQEKCRLFRISHDDANSLDNQQQANMEVIRSLQWHLTWAYRPQRWPGAPAAARRTHTPLVSHSSSWRGFQNPHAPTLSPLASSTPSPEKIIYLYTT